jgi:long-chain fatty acid transport protein
MKSEFDLIRRASAATFLFAVSGAGFGAGFYLPELGSPASLGTGGVANVTNNLGADASITNPAGMSGIDDQRVLTGLQFFLPRIEFDVKDVESVGLRPATGDDGGNAGIITPVPSLFYVRPLSDRVRFGFSVTGPLGGGVDYGNRFIGRYAVQNAILGALALTPSISYAVNDKLSIGAGISALYTFFEQKIAVRQPLGVGDATVKFDDLDGWGAQAILGMQYKFTDRLLLGVVYRSKADTDLEGDVKTENWRLPFRLADDIEISWTNPQWLEAGIRYRLNDKTMVAVNLGWQAWSEFSENELAIGEQVNVLDRNWDNTWHTGIALSYDLSERSRLALGFTYDSSPVEDEFRTFDFPVDEMWKLSAAYGWAHGDNLQFALGATVYFVDDAPIDQTAQGVRVVGEYSTNRIATVGGSLNYTF